MVHEHVGVVLHADGRKKKHGGSPQHVTCVGHILNACILIV